MNTYRIIFKPHSTISTIPDAQTIFGAICNIIIHTQGQEHFESYVQSFNTTEPLLVHSSMFPMGFFPVMKSNIFSIDYINKKMLNESAQEQLEYFQGMKNCKNIQFISEDIYRKYISDGNIEAIRDGILDYEYTIRDEWLESEETEIEIKSKLNTHVQKRKYYFKESDENSLYYQNDIYCSEDMLFQILVKTTMSQEELLNIFKYSDAFGFGSRHSVGKNSFKLIDIQPINIQGKVKMLLSKCMYDEDIDYQNSNYQMISKEYRTSKSYMNHKMMGRFNLLAEGSVLSTKKDKEWYGKVKKITIDNDNAVYYYAIGFVL